MLIRYLGERRSSFGHAFRGLATAMREQPNLRIYLLATIAVSALLLWLRLEAAKNALVVIAIGMVWVSELVNSALEATVDLATADVDLLARKAKDMAAAAVLISSATALDGRSSYLASSNGRKDCLGR